MHLGRKLSETQRAGLFESILNNVYSVILNNIELYYVQYENRTYEHNYKQMFLYISKKKKIPTNIYKKTENAQIISNNYILRFILYS